MSVVVTPVKSSRVASTGQSVVEPLGICEPYPVSRERRGKGIRKDTNRGVDEERLECAGQAARGRLGVGGVLCQSDDVIVSD